MSRLALYLLGPPRVELDDEEVHIPRRKAMALLSYLAVTKEAHRRDSLATLLWPEHDHSRARANLRGALLQLNRALGEGWLTTARETTGLDPKADVWLDVDVFRRKLAACETHGHLATDVCPACIPLLEQAVGLYRDDFLAGFTLDDSPEFDEFQFFQTEGVRDELAGVLERLVRWHRGQGEYEAAIPYARRWLALDSLHEPAHRHLMVLYARSGQQSAAVRQYQLCQQTLVEELGLPPSEETVALYERIRSGEEIRWEREVPSRPPHNLPPQPTPFVGRREELADLDRLIGDPEVRLVTVTGPGGIGKTRLALAAAEQQLDVTVLADSGPAVRFPHGVYFVPLAGLMSPDQVIPAMAQAMSLPFREERESRQQMLDYLREKRLLLLMDNLEHLLAPSESAFEERSEGGAELLAEILETAPGIQILATSRERLHLRQEQVYPLQGLACPDWETSADVPADADPAAYDAINLFLHTGRRVQPHFQLVEDALAPVARVCRLVEGMPLGIELAAAWVDVLPPADIAAETQRSLDFLEADWRDMPPRHRSVRAAFDASWGRLSQAERDVFPQLCVFCGGFTRQAAQEVATTQDGASEFLRTLAALAEKSLLQYDQVRDRYQIHELLRQCGADKLGTDPDRQAAVHDRHCAYYCSALQGWEADLRGARQQTAVAEIEADHENIRSAWFQAVEKTNLHHLEIAANGLGEFYATQGRWSEGEAMFRRAAEKLRALYGPSPGTATAARLLARFLAWQAALSLSLYSTAWREQQKQLLQQSLAVLASPVLAEEDISAEEAFARLLLGDALSDAWSQKLLEEGRQHLEASLRLYRMLGDDVGTADALFSLHHYARVDGASERAERLLTESLTLVRQAGEPLRIARCLLALGHINRDDLLAYDRARELYEQAYAVSETAGQLQGMEEAQRIAAYLAWFLGEFDVALSHFEEALALSRRAGSQLKIAENITNIGLMHGYRGRFSQAVALIQEAITAHLREDEEYTEICLAHMYIHAGQYKRGQALARAAVADEGIWMGPALAQRYLGWVALVEEKYAEALAFSQRSVALCRPQKGAQEREHHAWAWAVLGRALHGLDQHVESRRVFYDALRTCVEIRAFLPLLHLIPLIPVVLVDDESDRLKERAVELYALAESHPFVANSQLFEDIAGQHIKAAAATLPLEVVESAQERGRKLDWWDTAAELLEELSDLGWAG